MYRQDRGIYDDLARAVIDIYIDYNIRSFPLDENEICKTLGVELIPYSSYKGKKREILLKKSPWGFFSPKSAESDPIIFFNDSYDSVGAQRLTVFHELKHYVFEDEDDSDDDLAEYFGRYFMCPIPYMLLNHIDTPNEIVSYCGLSLEAANYASENIHNRRKKYGYKIFDYEIPLIEHLEPALLETY